MKKIIVIILLIALSVGFAACGNNGSSIDSTTESTFNGDEKQESSETETTDGESGDIWIGPIPGKNR